MQPFSSQPAPAMSLEAALGNPYSNTIFGFAHRVAEDEDERYPLKALRWLDQWGMQRQYVPVSLGGDLRDFEVLFSLVRTISRRDLTVAVTHAVSFLGSAGIWISGSPALKKKIASRLLAGERISLALTEREHGGDLLSGETRAEHEAGLYRLSGEKWLINGATHNPLVAVLARTSENSGPRAFSLFIFDKHEARPGDYTLLDKVRTLGVRGGDISGIHFHRSPLAHSDMTGVPGQGFETVIKGLYLSRLLCGAMSLGSAETAFRVTMDFSMTRSIFGGTVCDIPWCRRQLVECWVDLLLCESLLAAASRSLHFFPAEAGVHSAVVKYLVPRLLEQTLKQLSIVLGARYFLREGQHFGIFQKMLRDSSLISLFDGSSLVNLYSLTTQFRALARVWRENQKQPSNGHRLQVCDLTSTLPEFDWSGLSLVSDGRNCFTASLRSAIAEAREITETQSLPAYVAVNLQQQVNGLESAAERLMAAIGTMNFGSPHSVRPEAFDYADNYCLVAGAAMALQVWLANRHYADGDFWSGEWLVLALSRLNTCLGQKTCLSDSLMKDLGNQLLRNHAERPGCWAPEIRAA